MPVIDLSPQVSNTAPHWPGDHGYTRNDRWRIDGGDSVTVGTVTTTGHIGSHIDAPAHVAANGVGIEGIPLEHCIGPCVVVDARHLIDRTRAPHGYAEVLKVIARLEKIAGGTSIERLLLRHRDEVAGNWYTASPGLDPDLVHWFGQQGGKLIGVDLDSFDPLDNPDLPAHRAAIAANIVILEGLNLVAAPVTAPEQAAEYWPVLSALPVHWVGTDAAPVRAVLHTRTPQRS